MSDPEPDKSKFPEGVRHVKKKYPRSKQKKSISFEAAPGDIEALESIMATLGIGQSEAVRTCIRVYAALMKK